MKNLITLSLSAVAFMLLGCEEIILDENNEVNSSVSGNYLPKEKDSEGVSVKLTDYLYPKELGEDKTFYFENVYNYAQNKNNAFDGAPDISQRSYTKQVNDTITRITEFKDTKQEKYDEIYQDKILSYETSIPLEFPINVAKNTTVSEVTEGDITKRCVVRYIGAKDLEPILPLYVKNDLLNNYLEEENGGFILSQFNHMSVMHIYCGTTDRHTTDSYYTSDFGLVLKVEKDIDKDILKVEVVDVAHITN